MDSIIRKEIRSLTTQEKSDFIKAVLALKANGTYNQFVLWHAQAAMTPAPAPGEGFRCENGACADNQGDADWRSAAHLGPAFLPWHREFIYRFEKELQKEVPEIALPYWDWTIDARLENPLESPVWADDFMGGDGDPNDNNFVKTGPFKYDQSNPNTWRVVDMDGNPGEGLRRQFATFALSLPSNRDVLYSLSVVPYDTPNWNILSSPSFRNVLEGWILGPSLHNRVHVWVGGDMLFHTSPNDPVFFLNHCNVDRIWAIWQDLHPGESYVPYQAGPRGHNLHDAMPPWETMPSDVLDYRALGYEYDVL
jgi:tyrosinase